MANKVDGIQEKKPEMTYFNTQAIAPPPKKKLPLGADISVFMAKPAATVQ